ncbi:MAG: hypothetical protein AABX14_02460, partial [Candidatus Aenigmatarchaeota archaeon]
MVSKLIFTLYKILFCPVTQLHTLNAVRIRPKPVVTGLFFKAAQCFPASVKKLNSVNYRYLKIVASYFAEGLLSRIAPREE